MSAIVYRYRVPYRTRTGQVHDSGKPRMQRVDVPQAVRDQLRLAHNMRNDLVAAQRTYDDAKRAMWSQQPQVAAIEAQLQPLEGQLAELTARAGREHSDDRTITTRADTAAEIRQVQERARALRQQRRDVQAQLADQVRPDLHRLAQELRAATRTDQQVVAIRRRYAAQGLHWATYNSVVDSHVAAVRRVEDRRTAGQPAQLRFKRWDGTGTLSVQLQREHGDACRCAGCAERAVRAWRLRETPDGVTLVHRRTPDQVLYPASLDEVCQRVAAATGLPTAALSIERRKPRKGQPGMPYIAVDAGLLSGGDAAGPADPVRSPELLAGGGGKWANVLQLRPWEPPEQHQQRGWSARRLHGTLRWGMGRDRAVELPVTLHRMIPAEADVCEAQLTVYRTADQERMQVTVTALLPDPTPVIRDRRVAVHCGWRQRDDGAVRVAVWRAAGEPVAVPDHLADVVESHEGGRWGEIIAPASWLDVAGRPASLQGIRDTSLAPVADKLASWLDEHPQPDPSDEEPDRQLTGAVVRRWRSAGRFAALTHRWLVEPPSGHGAADVVAMLGAWQVQDLHLWQWQAHERQQTGWRRDDRWRSVAAWLAREAGVLVLDDTNLADLRRRDAVTDVDPVLPGEQAQKARARAGLVAPGELRASVRAAGVRDGVPVAVVESRDVTRTCPHCEQVGDPHPRYAASAVVACPRCGAEYDQDRSAVELMLLRERS